MADVRDITLGRDSPAELGDLAGRVSELKTSPGLRRCFRFFENSKKWIDERHLEICRVPALTFREQQRAEFIAEMWR